MPLSSKMCELSTEEALKAVLTLCQEASPVRISPSPASGLESSKESEAGFGKSMPESWVKYDPDSSLWKMSQGCLLTGLSESFSGTWPRWGLMLNGMCYQPVKSELRTGESESGWLPTPSASGGGYNKSPGKNSKIRPSLETMARHGSWPTPCARDGKGSDAPNRGGGASLCEAVRGRRPKRRIGKDRT